MVICTYSVHITMEDFRVRNIVFYCKLTLSDYQCNQVSLEKQDFGDGTIHVSPPAPSIVVVHNFDSWAWCERDLLLRPEYNIQNIY